MAEGKKAFEDILRQRETDDELLPGKQGSVEETGEALEQVGFVRYELSREDLPEGYPSCHSEKGMNRWARRGLHLFDLSRKRALTDGRRSVLATRVRLFQGPCIVAKITARANDINGSTKYRGLLIVTRLSNSCSESKNALYTYFVHLQSACRFRIFFLNAGRSTGGCASL